MPDIEVLRELTPQFPPPGLDDLVTVVHRRRRRAALTVGAGALAAVVVVASLIAGVPRSDRSIDPVTDPDGQTDDRAAEDPSWAPDRIRAEGRSRDYLNGQDGALEARSWRVCGKADCDYAETGDNYDYRVYHAALEVTVDGYRTSSLFSLNGGQGDWPETLMQPFDDDSVFVQDWDRPGGTEERYRLLNVDGSTTELTMLPTTAAPAPGPDVVRTSYSSYGLARVDETARTIERLDLPDAVYLWAESAADDLLWGITSGCAVYWQRPRGDFAHRKLECKDPDQDPLFIDYVPRITSWFTAERMVVTELGGSKGLPVALHVSLDRGDTWQRLPVTERTMYDVLEQVG